MLQVAQRTVNVARQRAITVSCLVSKPAKLGDGALNILAAHVPATATSGAPIAAERSITGPVASHLSVLAGRCVLPGLPAALLPRLLARAPGCLLATLLLSTLLTALLLTALLLTGT